MFYGDGRNFFSLLLFSSPLVGQLCSREFSLSFSSDIFLMTVPANQNVTNIYNICLLSLLNDYVNHSYSLVEQLYFLSETIDFSFLTFAVTIRNSKGLFKNFLVH